MALLTNPIRSAVVVFGVACTCIRCQCPKVSGSTGQAYSGNTRASCASIIAGYCCIPELSPYPTVPRCIHADPCEPWLPPACASGVLHKIIVSCHIVPDHLDTVFWIGVSTITLACALDNPRWIAIKRALGHPDVRNQGAIRQKHDKVADPVIGEFTGEYYICRVSDIYRRARSWYTFVAWSSWRLIIRIPWFQANT